MRGDGDRRRLLLSKYLSTYFLIRNYPLEAHLSRTVCQQGTKPKLGFTTVCITYVT